jgi:hypothetical protein
MSRMDADYPQHMAGGQERQGMGPKRRSRRLGPRYVFFVCLMFFLTNQTYFFNI